MKKRERATHFREEVNFADLLTACRSIPKAPTLCLVATVARWDELKNRFPAPLALGRVIHGEVPVFVEEKDLAVLNKAMDLKAEYDSVWIAMDTMDGVVELPDWMAPKLPPANVTQTNEQLSS